jgi:hypothetical protein
MTMLRELKDPNAREAQENLRIIRGLMERSTKHSTFSGYSGILAGLASIVGCMATSSLVSRGSGTPEFRQSFLAIWSSVILFALTCDYLLTKRRAEGVGKRILSRLGKQMVLGATPGLGTGGLLTFVLLQHNLINTVYAVWMLCYGIAVSAVGQFSQREVSYLGAAFLCAGALTICTPSLGLTMMAIAFGGFHMAYGIAMSRKDGW